MGYVRPKRAKRPANRPKWPSHSLRRRVWTTRFFEIHDPGAFDEHFFNGLLEKMAEIASSDEASTPVIDWDKEDQQLHVTDPFFAFFLKWGVLQ